MADEWTLDELAGRVADALSVGYSGPVNARVRDVPDRRAIRWYTTIGLLDRPLATRGRTARYGPRHLLQLVAIKQRQAAGRTLAEIQAELLGASDETLRAIAGRPETGDAPTPDEARRRFWAAPPVATAASPVAASPAPARLRSGMTLPGGLTLVLPAGAGVPSGEDLAAVAAAAGPLLAELATRGLLPGDGVADQDPLHDEHRADDGAGGGPGGAG